MTARTRIALLAELPSQARALVRVTGEDATRFLQGLLSADVGELTPGRVTPATLLTVKGKIVSEVWVLAVSEDEPWLALPADIADAVLEKLDAHIIMDDVELEPLPELECAIVWHESGLHAVNPGAQGDLRIFDTTVPLPGVLLVGSRDALAQLEGLGELADAEQFTAARVAHGRPAWGFEIAPDRFPPEVGFVDAVSYDKGCFMGQEPLSRIHNRGAVNRVMVRVRLSEPLAEPGATPVALSFEEREVGQLTSVTAAGEGLAIVRRVHARPGKVLTAGAISVEVISEPIGDDPGGPGRQRSATVSLGGRR